MSGSLVKKHFLTVLGISGFIFGALIILLTPKDTFHEIDYKPRDILTEILSDTNSLKNIPAGDTILEKEIAYRLYLVHNLSDSMCSQLLFDKQLYVNKVGFYEMALLDYDSARTKALIPLDYYIHYSLLFKKDIRPYHISKKAHLSTKEYASYREFISKYPGFILWMFLIVVQFPLFMFLSIFAFQEINKFRKLVAPTVRITLPDKIWVCAIVILAFVGISFFTFFKGHPIMGGLFCSKFYIHFAFGALLLFAGLSGTASFTGFMVVTEYGKNISDNPAGQPEAEKINILNRLFNHMLICASVALSIIVLATGVLFSGLNNMEFIKKMTTDFGHSPVAYHFVFLIGILCSGLILFFFFPAKIQLMNLQKAYKVNNPEGEGLEKSEDLMAMIRTLFTVGMPALIPVIQFIINLFLKGH